MTRVRTIVSRLPIAALALALATACEPSRYSHVELYRVGGHASAEIEPGGLSVPEGGVLVLEAQPYAEAGSPAYVGLERFTLRPANPDVAMAHRAILRDTWVISGRTAGSTELQVIVDGAVVDEVPVEIFALEEGGS